jgi:glycosyltransferase involved in cell wall biosynthesis
MITRRTFLKTGSLATAGLALGGLGTVNSMTAASASGILGANRKVNLACVGIGNRGAEIINAFHKTGLESENGNTQALAEAINKLLSDNDLRKKLGENAAKRIQDKFTIEAIKDDLNNLYN